MTRNALEALKLRFWTLPAATALSVCAGLLGPAIGWAAAPPKDACLAALAELRELAPGVNTACMLRLASKGVALSFTTNSPLLADPDAGRAYMLYLFGSVGKFLNRNAQEGIESVEVANPALVETGGRLMISASELKSLQKQAVSGNSSLSGFYDALIYRVRLVRH